MTCVEIARVECVLLEIGEIDRFDSVHAWLAGFFLARFFLLGKSLGR